MTGGSPAERYLFLSFPKAGENSGEGKRALKKERSAR